MQTLSETIANLEKQNQEKDAQLNRYADEKHSLKEEWSAFKQSIQDLNSKNNLLEEQKDALQRQINSYSNERIALQGDLSALNETVQNLEREREVSRIVHTFGYYVGSNFVQVFLFANL